MLPERCWSSAGSHYNNGTPIDGSSGGDILMTSGAAVRSEDADLTLLAPDNVQLSLVTANSDGDATRGNVTVTADYAGPVNPGTYPSNNEGAISDALTGETASDVNLVAQVATLSAGTGIGSADDIDTDVVRLDAVNTGTSGHIQIQEVALGADGYIGVQRLAQTGTSGTGNLLLTTVDGTIEVLAGGSGVSVASAGRTITLDANVTDASHELPQGGDPRPGQRRVVCRRFRAERVDHNHRRSRRAGQHGRHDHRRQRRNRNHRRCQSQCHPAVGQQQRHDPAGRQHRRRRRHGHVQPGRLRRLGREPRRAVPTAMSRPPRS